MQPQEYIDRLNRVPQLIVDLYATRTGRFNISRERFDAAAFMRREDRFGWTRTAWYCAQIALAIIWTSAVAIFGIDDLKIVAGAVISAVVCLLFGYCFDRAMPLYRPSKRGLELIDTWDTFLEAGIKKADCEQGLDTLRYRCAEALRTVPPDDRTSASDGLEAAMAKSKRRIERAVKAELVYYRAFDRLGLLDLDDE